MLGGVYLVPRPRLHLIRFHGVLAPNAKLRAMVVPQGPVEGAEAAQPAECEANCAHHRPVRLSWARLLKRVFDLDLEHCPNCGGELKIIAAILEQPVIEKILTLEPPRWDARAQLTRPEAGDFTSMGNGKASAPGSREHRVRGLGSADPSRTAALQSPRK